MVGKRLAAAGDPGGESRLPVSDLRRSTELVICVAAAPQPRWIDASRTRRGAIPSWPTYDPTRTITSPVAPTGRPRLVGLEHEQTARAALTEVWLELVTDNRHAKTT